MNTKDNYTINPSYILRNDRKRAIITNKAGRDYFPEVPAKDSFHSIIHPLHAMILSFFTDGKPLDKKLNEISNFSGNCPENIYKFISKLCENKNVLYHQFSNHSFSLPQNILVKNRKYSGTKYNIEDFYISPTEYDFTSPRLYIPLDAIFVINTNCLTDCVYCYTDKTYGFNALPFSRIKKLIQEAKNIGMRNIDISGGEFLLHKDWEKILSLIIENGFHPYLSTKVPMHQKIITKLKDIGVKSIQVSIDTLIEDEAIKILKVKKGYIVKLINSLKILDKSGIKINTNTIITQSNSSLKSIEGTLNFLTSLQNIQRINFAVCGCSHYKENYLNYAPDIKDIQRIEDYIISKSSDFKGKINISFDDYFTNKAFTNNDMSFKEKKFPKRAMCTGNQSNFVILPDGKVTICEELYWHPTFIIVDLSKQSIMEVWNSQKAKELYYLNKNKIRDNSICKQCKFFDNCRVPKGVCWKMILKAYGNENWDYPDPRCPMAPEPVSTFYINS